MFISIYKKSWLVIVLFSINSFNAKSQIFTPKDYPKNYFSWPVDASKTEIVANFGELRPNHYHMGLDCRTDKRENIDVVASADGYIAKVKIEPYGFGRCIYINHPNGLTTVYAHLNAFESSLEKYITDQQYLLKKWNVFLDIPKNMFAVKQGDFIAKSGNTGGSQGPHTHFEIRETISDKCLNTLMFGLPIPDGVKPEILRLAVYDRTISTYDQSPKFYGLKKVNGSYQINGGKIIATSNRISFALTMQDKTTGSSNPIGAYAAAVFDNDVQISRFELDGISYAETRYLNANIDHKLKTNGGPYVQHLSPLPGYENKIYITDNSKGVVILNDSLSHQIKIVVADAEGNTTDLNFLVEPSKTKTATKTFTASQKLIPNLYNIFESANLKFYLPDNAIYDTINFNYKENASLNGTAIHQLHNMAIPIQTMFPVSIKGNFAIEDTGKIVMKRFAGSKQDFAKAEHHNGWYKASFRAFGNFQLLVDDQPPIVTPIGIRNGANLSNSNRIIFRVKDNTEEIANFEALLDGQWLRFSNDKGVNFIYNFDDRCTEGEHQLKITAVDQVGNKTEQIYNFTR